MVPAGSFGWQTAEKVEKSKKISEFTVELMKDLVYNEKNAPRRAGKTNLGGDLPWLNY